MNPYNRIIEYSYRKGTEEDPYIEINENKVITNGIITLIEIPDDFNHVKINNMNEIYSNNIISSDQFYVDYISGAVYFHPDLENENIEVNYYGKGMIIRGYGY
ncbi:MAG: hypothetical protein M0Q94_02610 [Candidatus Cloacimonetes bacterium]|nr:hypothetical protein [Candidatus Cloacimonadota bacterium]